MLLPINWYLKGLVVIKAFAMEALIILTVGKEYMKYRLPRPERLCC